MRCRQTLIAYFGKCACSAYASAAARGLGQPCPDKCNPEISRASVCHLWEDSCSQRKQRPDGNEDDGKNGPPCVHHLHVYSRSCTSQPLSGSHLRVMFTAICMVNDPCNTLARPEDARGYALYSWKVLRHSLCEILPFWPFQCPVGSLCRPL